MRTYRIKTKAGWRSWQADDAAHAREQHVDAFGDDDPFEKIQKVEEVKLALESALKTKKSPSQLNREIAAALSPKSGGSRGRKHSTIKKDYDSPPPGLTYGQQWPKDRRYMLVDDKTGKDMRPALDFEVDQIQASRHGVKALELRGGIYSVRLRDPDEMFTVKDRDGNVLGESKSTKGAMALAPKDKSYAIVRGEYTSDGRYWGPGSGRTMAVREFHPTGGFRWYVG